MHQLKALDLDRDTKPNKQRNKITKGGPLELETLSHILSEEQPNSILSWNRQANWSACTLSSAGFEADPIQLGIRGSMSPVTPLCVSHLSGATQICTSEIAGAYPNSLV